MKSVETPVGTVDAAGVAKSIAARMADLQGRRRADVMFVLDCTGSMQGEIDAIKDAITAFADTIESDGVRVRVGLIEFRDRLIGEEHRVLTFGGEPFTADPTVFRREISALKASGGGDEPESSLDALRLALRQPFSSEANKVLVLVTDAPPHIPDHETKSIEELVAEVRSASIQQFYLVFRTHDPQSQVYLKLLEGTRGVAFELGTGDDFRNRAEDFKRTLMSLGKTISSATR
jgi:Mg-chelatase subunit ChlD